MTRCSVSGSAKYHESRHAPRYSPRLQTRAVTALFCHPWPWERLQRTRGTGPGACNSDEFTQRGLFREILSTLEVSAKERSRTPAPDGLCKQAGRRLPQTPRLQDRGKSRPVPLSPLAHPTPLARSRPDAHARCSFPVHNLGANRLPCARRWRPALRRRVASDQQTSCRPVGAFA